MRGWDGLPAQTGLNTFRQRLVRRFPKNTQFKATALNIILTRLVI